MNIYAEVIRGQLRLGETQEKTSSPQTQNQIETTQAHICMDFNSKTHRTPTPTPSPRRLHSSPQ